MKLLIVSNLFYPDYEGGAEKVARRAAEELSRLHEVTVLATGDMTRVDTVAGGYDVVRVPYRNIYPYKVGQSTESIFRRFLWHTRNALGGISRTDLERVVNERKPGVVYMHNSSAFLPQLANLCRDRGLPLCAHLHDYALLCPKTSMYEHDENCGKPCLKCRFLTWPARKAMQVTSHVIAVSNFVQRRHLQYGLFTGSQWNVLRNVERDSEYIPLCHRPPSDNASIVIGYIGSLAPAKGLEDLIDAFLSTQPGSARLVIAGTGNNDFVEPLKARTADREVKWLGHVEPDEFYEDIDCLVVSSRWHEPQALVVVEAINRGIPLIASRRGGNTEMLEEYQVGLLYEPVRPRELADTLNLIIQYSRKNWREAIPKKFPALAEGGSITVKNTSYFDQLENVLSACATNKGAI